jgi:hypothetical protein
VAEEHIPGLFPGEKKTIQHELTTLAPSEKLEYHIKELENLATTNNPNNEQPYNSHRQQIDICGQELYKQAINKKSAVTYLLLIQVPKTWHVENPDSNQSVLIRPFTLEQINAWKKYAGKEETLV